MAKVLVAGGGGFIGSHFVDLLLARGHSVVVVDNFITGRKSNLELAGKQRHFKFVVADVCDDLLGIDLLTQKFDAVVNMASPASPVDFLKIPLEILSVGSQGTKNLLEIARRDSATFLLASTSEVYGDPFVHPQPESYLGNVSSIGPRGCYDEAKRYAEALTVAYRRMFGVQTRIVRIFNTYGPRMKPSDGRVVTNFIEAALSEKPLFLYGSGAQTRSFCYVSDEVDGIYRLLFSNYQDPVNIGNPDEFTVRQLAEAVIEITGSKSEIVVREFPDERVGDPQRRCPDVSLAKEVIGWEPTVSLHDGLKKAIDYYKNFELSSLT